MSLNQSAKPRVLPRANRAGGVLFWLLVVPLFVHGLGSTHTVALAAEFVCESSYENCDDFTGPYEDCPPDFVPYANVTTGYEYPVGLHRSTMFRLLQVCRPQGAPGCPNFDCCRFPDLFVEVDIYPRKADDFICDVCPTKRTPGTTIEPPLDTAGLFPSGACPFQLHIEYVEQTLVCPGNLPVSAILRTRSERIRDPGDLDAAPEKKGAMGRLLADLHTARRQGRG